MYQLGSESTIVQRVDELRGIINERLTPLIRGDYVLLDCPFHSNIGDVMIWEGERQFLSKLPHQCLGQSSMLTYDPQMELEPSVTILLHGGGNFGDVWRAHSDFRLEIVERYPNNPIVVLPQTVHYNDQALIGSDAERFAQHQHLTICARDQRSYALLKENFANNVLLLPDMAFCIEQEWLSGWQKSESAGAVYIMRRDHELAVEQLPEELPEGTEVRDWPTFERFDYATKRLLWMARGTEVARKRWSGGWLANWLAEATNSYASDYYAEHSIKRGVEFLSPYAEVYTTRLHGGILAMLLDKKCCFYDNIYGKNSTFYHTWLKGVCRLTLQMESPQSRNQASSGRCSP